MDERAHEGGGERASRGSGPRLRARGGGVNLSAGAPERRASRIRAASATTTRTASSRARRSGCSCSPTAWADTTPGEVASGMATSLIADGLQEAWHAAGRRRASGATRRRRLSERLIREQIARANSAIYTTSQNNPECAGMGTTLVVMPLLRQLRHRGAHRRFAPVPPARRGDGAGHARPFAAAGAARLRPHHAGGSEAFAEQEPRHARPRHRPHGRARDPRVRDAARRHLPAVLRRAHDMVEDEEIRLTLHHAEDQPDPHGAAAGAGGERQRRPRQHLGDADPGRRALRRAARLARAHSRHSSGNTQGKRPWPSSS